ncbi:MAG: acetylxylan esterase [Thermoguttaceae bacterium]|nr:acetylxylan esterase [Thermoguttaceae bacterium]MDW8078279.1 acetylxylan esterase [Thermoguttaceae bacterium]
MKLEQQPQANCERFASANVTNRSLPAPEGRQPPYAQSSVICSFVLLCFVFHPYATWGQEAELKQILGFIERSSVQNLCLLEVQRFCESKVAELSIPENVEAWEAYANSLRARILEKIVFRGVPREWREHPLRVEWLDPIPAGPGYRLRKLRYEALPGLWVPAVLYEPEKITGRVPAVLNVNGHTPLGKQYPPKQLRCINMAKKGVIALNIEWVGMGQLSSPGYHHGRMNQLDLCGVSGLAVFFLNMQRGVDVLLSLEQVDPTRIGMTGLSGGGWQTIVLSSLDTRIKLANPVAGYSSFRTRVWHHKDLGDSEQTPTDLAALADYTHLTALLAPRPALLTYNAKDECCFEAGYALEPLVKAARPVYELYGKGDFLRTHINYEPGTHNYEVDNRQAFYRMLRDFFADDPASFDATEIPSEAELKSAEELYVPLPEDNADFNKLARQLAAHLPAGPSPPAEAAAYRNWVQKHREQVESTVRFRRFRPESELVFEEKAPGYVVRIWRIVQDGTWTTPAVEFVPGQTSGNNPQGGGETASPPWVLLVSEEDNTAVCQRVLELVRHNRRVLLVRPTGYSERAINYLWHLLLASVGERTVGLQASEIAAAARWWRSQVGNKPIELIAWGQRSCLAALLAALMDQEAIDALVLVRPLGSLQEVIENNWDVTSRPDFFCFGLLATTDIPWLAVAMGPRSVRLKEAPQRLREALAKLPHTEHIKFE